MNGPGKYDDACTQAREMTKAEGVILLVFNGHAGNGFSAQLPAELLLLVPELLRTVADTIEGDVPHA